MKKISKYGCLIIASVWIINSLAIVIPTSNKNVDVYLGLFGSTSNPAQSVGCYMMKNSAYTGKQLIENSYTVMSCIDGVNKIATPGTLAASDTPVSQNMDDLMRTVLTKASAFQLGLNFSFNS